MNRSVVGNWRGWIKVVPHFIFPPREFVSGTGGRVVERQSVAVRDYRVAILPLNNNGKNVLKIGIGTKFESKATAYGVRC